MHHTCFTRLICGLALLVPVHTQASPVDIALKSGATIRGQLVDRQEDAVWVETTHGEVYVPIKTIKAEAWNKLLICAISPRRGKMDPVDNVFPPIESYSTYRQMKNRGKGSAPEKAAPKPEKPAKPPLVKPVPEPEEKKSTDPVDQQLEADLPKNQPAPGKKPEKVNTAGRGKPQIK